MGLGSKAAHVRSSAQYTLDAFGNEVGRGTAVALAEALVPRVYVTERLLSLQRTQPAPPLHTRHVLPAGRRETACGLVARGQQSRCRGVGWVGGAV